MIHTKESLIAFEKKVADAFLEKQIKAPIHLSGGNEDQLLAIFRDVRPGDWVFSTWRSHYHALLKGIPESWVWDEILAGRSMYLMNREHRFFSSAIVGGILPVACGVAMGVKRLAQRDYLRWGQSDQPKVWVFVGDMTARTGLFHEFVNYCGGHDLPVKVVIENNGLSTNTPTHKAWGGVESWHGKFGDTSVCECPPDDWPYPDIFYGEYHYQRTYPHVGVGQHVAF